jgi:hypothetical protein
MFQIKIVEEIKAHVLCSETFSRIVPFMRCQKCGAARQNADNMAPARGILDK